MPMLAQLAQEQDLVQLSQCHAAFACVGHNNGE